jgi:hypothetical protein
LEALSTGGEDVYMEVPPIDPAKLLDIWMRWERGEDSPGRIMADLKIARLPELLTELIETAAAIEFR